MRADSLRLGRTSKPSYFDSLDNCANILGKAEHSARAAGRSAKPDQLTAPVHLAASAAIACADYGALWQRLAPKTVVANEFKTVTRLECIALHLITSSPADHDIL
jgi:hypothetical protein